MASALLHAHPCAAPSTAKDPQAQDTHKPSLKMEKENAAEEPWTEVKRGELLASAGCDQPKKHEGDEKRYEHEGWKTSAVEGDP